MYTNLSSFNWQSDLTDERKFEIIEWIKNLTDNEKGMLKDIIKDCIQEERDSNNPDL